MEIYEARQMNTKSKNLILKDLFYEYLDEKVDFEHFKGSKSDCKTYCEKLQNETGCVFRAQTTFTNVYCNYINYITSYDIDDE